jgi:hypothetical protein|tara:strand:+ start:2915 stop:4438 length:1524 start_codon:yes stop_codon:yes gene_type:complete
MAIPLFEIKLSKKPIAIIKTGDRQLAFIKINKFDVKYFATKEFGVFELDDEYEYRYKNTSIYLYNHANSKPISLSAMQEIDQTMRKFGDTELLNVPRLKGAVGEDFNFENLPPDRTRELSNETKRFLGDFQVDDEAQKTNTMIKVHHQKHPIKAYSGNLIGMGINRGHFACVEIAYKKLDIVPMYLHDDRAYTKYGVFQYFKDNIYLLKKQQVSFFILNDKTGKPITPQSKPATKMMTGLVKKKRWDFLETFHKPNGNHERKEMPKNVTMSSEKSLVQYTADSPQIFANTLAELHHTHNAVITRISSLSKKAIPIMLVLAALMGFVILISNLPPIIDKVAEVTGMQPPKVVYLTPDEATARGLDPRDIPTVDLTATDPKEFCDRNPSKCDGDMVLPEFDTTTTETMVIDEMPIITVPENIVGEADNPNGMRIKFTVSVTDDVDEFPIVNCDPPSNKIFPIGESTVTCTSTDSGGNTATATFLVTIIGESESVVEQLIPDIPTPDLTP